jgi:DNA-binding transcriptional ArsR family regulator
MVARSPSSRPAGRPSARESAEASARPVPWTFLSNHAHVLISIALDPEARMRDVADRVGVTERAVQRIVGELEEAGYLVRRKEGRRNHYEVTASRPLRHPIEKHCSTEQLLDLVIGRR